MKGVEVVIPAQRRVNTQSQGACLTTHNQQAAVSPPLHQSREWVGRSFTQLPSARGRLPLMSELYTTPFASCCCRAQFAYHTVPLAGSTTCAVHTVARDRAYHGIPYGNTADRSRNSSEKGVNWEGGAAVPLAAPHIHATSLFSLSVLTGLHSIEHRNHISTRTPWCAVSYWSETKWYFSKLRFPNCVLHS